VTADVRDASELEFAFSRAFKAISEDQPKDVIVEKSISADFRLLCVADLLPLLNDVRHRLLVTALNH